MVDVESLPLGGISGPHLIILHLTSSHLHSPTMRSGSAIVILDDEEKKEEEEEQHGLLKPGSSSSSSSQEVGRPAE